MCIELIFAIILGCLSFGIPFLAFVIMLFDYGNKFSKVFINYDNSSNILTNIGISWVFIFFLIALGVLFYGLKFNSKCNNNNNNNSNETFKNNKKK